MEAIAGGTTIIATGREWLGVPAKPEMRDMSHSSHGANSDRNDSHQIKIYEFVVLLVLLYI